MNIKQKQSTKLTQITVQCERSKKMFFHWNSWYWQQNAVFRVDLEVSDSIESIIKVKEMFEQNAGTGPLELNNLIILWTNLFRQEVMVDCWSADKA